MVRKNIVRDVSQVLRDIQAMESNTRRRTKTTWARPGDKVSARRVQNIMSYILDHSRKLYTENSVPPVTRALDIDLSLQKHTVRTHILSIFNNKYVLIYSVTVLLCVSSKLLLYSSTSVHAPHTLREH